MIEFEIGKSVSFRANEYDVEVMQMISEAHPQIPDVAGVLREALRRYHIEATDGNSKSKRLERLEGEVVELKHQLGYMQHQMDRMEKILLLWQNEHTPGK